MQKTTLLCTVLHCAALYFKYLYFTIIKQLLEGHATGKAFAGKPGGPAEPGYNLFHISTLLQKNALHCNIFCCTAPVFNMILSNLILGEEMQERHQIC